MLKPAHSPSSHSSSGGGWCLGRSEHPCPWCHWAVIRLGLLRGQHKETKGTNSHTTTHIFAFFLFIFVITDYVSICKSLSFCISLPVSRLWINTSSSKSRPVHQVPFQPSPCCMCKSSLTKGNLTRILRIVGWRLHLNLYDNLLIMLDASLLLPWLLPSWPSHFLGPWLHHSPFNTLPCSWPSWYFSFCHPYLVNKSNFPILAVVQAKIPKYFLIIVFLSHLILSL